MDNYDQDKKDIADLLNGELTIDEYRELQEMQTNTLQYFIDKKEWT